ncbi:CopG family transcriptional regulator [Candidatus Pacearchaeota archaeon]|nr:CopG family transcriptional regulator [Candidatus Pacearchaeota archaeon]
MLVIAIEISLTIDAEIWKEAKVHCVKNDLEYSSFVEQLIREKLKKQK